jgi:hypothetical protein
MKPKTKVSITEEEKKSRQIFNNFLGHPDFESFLRLRVHLIRIGDREPCCAFTCNLGEGECSGSSCPLSGHSEPNDVAGICYALSSEFDDCSGEVLDYWDNHQGEILLHLTRFKTYWR